MQFPANEEDIYQQRTILFPFYVDMVISEPIYETWHRHKFNYGGFTPLTVTNVEGGVGLFIAAVRVHYSIDAELTIHFRRSDCEGSKRTKGGAMAMLQIEPWPHIDTKPTSV